MLAMRTVNGMRCGELKGTTLLTSACVVAARFMIYLPFLRWRARVPGPTDVARRRAAENAGVAIR